ncbi:metalloregulator ArsR/SmtB family transcription factor [Rhodobacteraceae bacterium 2CG4]|uniref:Metalloregulator ArsR/SmtB family transcription factor n=1 Tax=Halovulum marinum TaxID=2662447 RepID=A0A6L5YZS2_9RHOB|nr:metalloregulator ArsR/SmtB family transcription factor [Halovulum marinum]MSU89761.1 metalloregulator ArsR/SmtB family transcription factor [Halovulum marinum]
MPLPDAFAALGDPTRFAIVERLLAEGEKSAGEICGVVAVSAPSVSRHLKVLCDAGVLVRRAERQRRLYSANPAALQSIHRWAISHRQFWASSLDRLQRAVEGDRTDV